MVLAKTQDNECGESHGKEAKMAYKKPQIVAKSAAKQSFVAGCPEKLPVNTSCSSSNVKCMCGPLK